MKVITLNEAKANLNEYGQLCQEEEIIVTVNGSPSFRIAPLEDEDDDLSNELIEHNPEFRQLLGSRVGEPGIPAEEARNILGLPPRKKP